MRLTVVYKPGHGSTHAHDHGPEALYVAQGLQRLGYMADAAASEHGPGCVAVMAYEDDPPNQEQTAEIATALRRLTAQWLQLTMPRQEFQP